MERAGLQLPLVWVRELYSQTAYFSPRWEASQGCLPEEGAASFVAAILFDAGAHCIKVKFWREVSRLLLDIFSNYLQWLHPAPRPSAWHAASQGVPLAVTVQ